MTVPIRVGVNVIVAEPISKIDGTSLPVNRALLLQICLVAELSHTQKDESVSKEANWSKSSESVEVE
jgi:hypothetical protein